MGEVSAYPQGTFCWVNLGVLDADRAVSFYVDLHGWATEQITDDGVRFTVCRLAGEDVTAIYELSEEERAVTPPHWNSFISVGDIGAMVARADDLGASVLVEPVSVSGRTLAVLTDPTGAVFSLWEPAERFGAGLVNEPGTWTWNDLATRDPDGARDFYRDLFGWEFQQVAPDVGYFSISMGDLLIGGMRTMDDDPPELPPHWMPYFVVDDAEEAATRLGELGAEIIIPPSHVPTGRFLVFTDPAGASSALFEMGEGPVRGVDGS